MIPVFGDTVFYLAMTNPGDGLHHRAVVMIGQLETDVVTSSYILSELGNTLRRGKDRAAFVTLVADLKADPHTLIVSASEELFDAGLELFARRPDKEWSLTDCVSFIIMQRRGLTDALTADHHFEQAGFRALLR